MLKYSSNRNLLWIFVISLCCWNAVANFSKAKSISNKDILPFLRQSRILFFPILFNLNINCSYGVDLKTGNEIQAVLSEWYNYFVKNNFPYCNNLNWMCFYEDKMPMNKFYRQIYDFGPVALPFLIKELERPDYDIAHGLDRHFFHGMILPRTVNDIAKDTSKVSTEIINGVEIAYLDIFPQIRVIQKPEIYAPKELFFEWWRKVRTVVPECFNNLYLQCEKLKNEKKPDEARKVYRKIINFGIVALPLMIEKLEQGDIDFISAISELTDNKVKENWSVEACLKWWEENKNNYLVFP